MLLILADALTKCNSNQTPFIYKSYDDVSVIPRVGDTIKEYLFKGARKVVDVEFEYAESRCIIYLETIELQCSFEEYIERAKRNGWSERY